MWLMVGFRKKPVKRGEVGKTDTATNLGILSAVVDRGTHDGTT